MSEALVPGEVLDWPSFGRFKFAVGDLVFFYASSPVLQMIGKCEIEETDVPFNQVNPRNDLRKWPKHHSRIPWLRLRVLQTAPVPFKPLQRGSLYYHTEFKPSPYPKLLHDNEETYVMEAFDEAMTYRSDNLKHDGGIEEAALAKVERGEILRDSAKRLVGGRIESLEYKSGDKTLTVGLINGDDALTIRYEGVRRIRWQQDPGDIISGIRLSREDIYLLTTIDGLGLEILSSSLTLNP